MTLKLKNSKFCCRCSRRTRICVPPSTTSPTSVSSAAPPKRRPTAPPGTPSAARPSPTRPSTLQSWRPSPSSPPSSTTICSSGAPPRLCTLLRWTKRRRKIDSTLRTFNPPNEALERRCKKVWFDSCLGAKNYSNIFAFRIILAHLDF